MKKRKVCNELCLAMSKPAKGTEFCKLFVSQTSKTIRESLFLMLFPCSWCPWRTHLMHYVQKLYKMEFKMIQNDSK